MSRSGSSHATPERFHSLDALRGTALLLGIVLHAINSFLPSPVPLWLIEDNHRSQVLATLFFAIHIFRMTTFYLIAGFFAHMSFHRKGMKGFVRDRLKRIALPMVVGWPVTFVPILAISASVGRFPQTWPSLPSFPLGLFWFLYVLLQLYAAVLIGRVLITIIDQKGRLREGIDRVFCAVVENPFGPIILALPLSVALGASRRWLEYADISALYIGIPRADGSFITNKQTLIAFIVAFSAGWFLHRQIKLLDVLKDRWLANLCLAMGTAVTSVILVKGITPGWSASTLLTNNWIIFATAAACYAIATWSMTFAAIGLAVRYLSDFSPARRYIADSSYWLYLIHVPIVLALQAAVSRLEWPWPFKFAIILAVAFPLLFASYQFFVRYTFIGAVLNGPRKSSTERVAVRAKSLLTQV